LLDECSTTKEIQKVLDLIEGPWSIIYFQRSSQTLWFGRDYFGRRSLLISVTPYCLLLSSVTKRPNDPTISWVEVPTGLHSIKLSCMKQNTFNISTVPWLSVLSKQPKINFANLDYFTVSKESFLSSPILKHLYCNERSSYVDILSEHFFTEKLDPITELVRACDVKNLWSDCKELITFLQRAVSKRTRILNSWKGQSKVGVLFSGGLDCTVLALLADRVLPKHEPIDLLNVAFEQTKQSPADENYDTTLKYAVPDRITGVSSYNELKILSPTRQWNFIEINITIEELKKIRAEHIADLTYPKQTVLDDSIGCAIWFASRGKGVIAQNDSDLQYTSTARILLCGMGADEQLGGYSRHRTVFQRTSDWRAVDNEIKMEIDRISSRNLGRDDR